MPSVKVSPGSKTKLPHDKIGIIILGPHIKETIYRITTMEKIAIIKKGISKKQLIIIKDEVDLDYDELSELLAVSRANLIGKKGNEKFDASTSERILLLADVITYGRSVFGDNNLFNEWLKTPSRALGGITPLSMMDTLYGTEEVKNEIGRIAYGVY